MTDTRIITQADIHCTDTPTPSEAHNTSDRTPETLIPHEFGKQTTVASPTKTPDSPATTTNPKKRKLNASNTTPASPSTPASIVTFALYFCAAGPINILSQPTHKHRLGQTTNTKTDTASKNTPTTHTTTKQPTTPTEPVRRRPHANTTSISHKHPNPTLPANIRHTQTSRRIHTRT
ncbi:proteoglycan 4-like [Haliotis rufescens]|uniref:proteoglycan 4-like n=1 Tax=Haliotis rufescens TaxID=6454 RepID=UPI00201EDBBC|nr:proteoglycan 4-like [Haliotis rufescens]XP_048255151.1 proteoglycan 4-like [Haliotis rufescens]